MRMRRMQFSVRRLMIVVAVVGAALALAHAVRQPFAQSDWVDVTVRNVPPGIRQIYLIADGPDGPKALDWYEAKVIAFTEPARMGQLWYSNWTRTSDHSSARQSNSSLASPMLMTSSALRSGPWATGRKRSPNFARRCG